MEWGDGCADGRDHSAGLLLRGAACSAALASAGLSKIHLHSDKAGMSFASCHASGEDLQPDPVVRTLATSTLYVNHGNQLLLG